MLPVVAKFGTASEKTATRTTSMIHTAYSFKFSFFFCISSTSLFHEKSLTGRHGEDGLL